MKVEETLWVEKHRPKTIEELVLPDDYRTDFSKCVKNRDIGNLLFSGPAGGGKTTLARVLASKNGVISRINDNLLEINGSAKETRGISFVSDVIEPFLRIPPAGSDKFKIVFIDEGDFLTEASFRSLRGVIEKYSSHSRFILTCNYLSKIPDEVQSRFQLYIFKQVPIDYVMSYTTKIAETESIEYDEKDMKFLVNGLYPDIRRIVNALQKCSISGKLKVNQDIVLTNEKVVASSILEIIDHINSGEYHKINKSVSTISTLVSEQDLEYRSIYTNLFFIKGIPVPAKVTINKYANGHGGCLVPAMHFMAMVFEMIQSLQDYKMKIKK